jgi:hypothetical protein
MQPLADATAQVNSAQAQTRLVRSMRRSAQFGIQRVLAR